MNNVVPLFPEPEASATVQAFRILEARMQESAELILSDAGDIQPGSNMEAGLELLTDLVGNIHDLLEGGRNG